MFENFEKTAEEKIEECENVLKMKFPKEYRDFILNINGGVFDDLDHGFILNEVNEEIIIHVLYGINNNNSFDIYYHYKENSLYLPPMTISVGHTYSGDAILYIMDGPNKGLYLWDSSLYYEQSTPDECIYHLADDFTEFLDLIKL